MSDRIPSSKSADAYRTISEVSETLDIPPHVLRFWESKFPQVKPLKRGGGRRYYRRSDTDLLRLIRRLLYDEGYTIRGVQRLLKTKTQHGPMASATASDSGTGEAQTPNPTGSQPPSSDLDMPVDLASIVDLVAFARSEIEACRSILREAAQSVR